MQNESSENKPWYNMLHYTINVQYARSIDCPKKKLKGAKLHEVQGGLSETSPLRTDGSWHSQVGRLVHVSSGQRHSTAKLKGGGGHQDWVQSDQILALWGLAQILICTLSHRQILYRHCGPQHRSITGNVAHSTDSKQALWPTAQILIWTVSHSTDSK
jgi:hypothetical protein